MDTEINSSSQNDVLSIRDNDLRFERYLEEKHLRILPVAGDGVCFFICRSIFKFLSVKNCFYRSISLHVFDTPEKHAILRRLCAQFLLLKASYYTPFLNSPQMIQYFQHVSRNGVFGTNIELHALSWLLARPIIVYSDQEHVPDLTITTETCDSQTDPIRLTHQWNNHFNVAVTIGKRLDVGIGVCLSNHCFFVQFPFYPPFL